MKKAFLIVLILALCASSYAQGRRRIEKTMNSWLGKTKHSLILSWGPPTRTSEDGNGGEVLVYAYSQYRGSVPLMMGEYLPSRAWYDYRMFYVNSDSKIYSWRTSRENIPPQRVDLRIYNH